MIVSDEKCPNSPSFHLEIFTPGHPVNSPTAPLIGRLKLGTCESFFFVRIESRIESAVRFVFESNLRIESAVYTTQAVTRPDGPQAYRTGL